MKQIFWEIISDEYWEELVVNNWSSTTLIQSTYICKPQYHWWL